MIIPYRDEVRLVKAASGSYANTKSASEVATVMSVLLLGVNFSRINGQDMRDSDGVLYVDPENSFVISNNYRLEGFYVYAPMFGSDINESWFKITSVTINRDHLLNNEIDNVQCSLQKATPIPLVS